MCIYVYYYFTHRNISIKKKKNMTTPVVHSSIGTTVGVISLGLSATALGMSINNHNKIDDINTYVNIQNSTGLICGGNISINVDPTKFDISAGSGVIYDPINLARINVTWNNLVAKTTTFPINSILTYVSINSAGQAFTQTTQPTNTEIRNQILLGVLVSFNNPIISTVHTTPVSVLAGTNQLSDLSRALGYFNINGNIIANAGTALNIFKSTGHMYAYGSNFHNDVKNPNTIELPAIDTRLGFGGTFQYRFQDGTSSALSLTNLIPNILDVGTPYPSGPTYTGPTYTNNRWGTSRVYSFMSNTLKLQAPQFSYGSAIEAIKSINIEGYITEPSLLNGILIGFIISRGGATNLSLITDCVFRQAVKFSNSINSISHSPTTLQNAYDNSTNPVQIITSLAKGAFIVKAGNNNNNLNIFSLQNNTGTSTMSVTGNGNVIANGLDLSANLTMGNNQIQGLANAIADQDALNLRTADARYTQPSDITLQNGYNNSTNPVQIITSLAKGAFIVKAGNADNNLTIFDLQNNIGTPTMSVTGNGNVIANGLDLSANLTMGNNQIQGLANAVAAQDALNLRTADARYTQPSDITLQNGYNNSTIPVQIITSLAKGAFIVKAGNADNNLTIFDLQNNTGTSTMTVTGNGNVIANGLNLSAELTMGNNQIQNLADATTDQDALNRRTADARYTQPSDVTLQSGYNNSTNPVQIITSLAKGAFIVKAGNADNNLTIFDLQNNTGTSTMTVTGNGNVIANGLNLSAELTMGNNQIQNLADATTDQDALNRRTADARYTQPSDVTLQSGYNNSTNPVQIITSLAKGAFIVKAGNADNNLTIFDLQNNTGTSTMSVTGNGNVIANGLDLSANLTMGNNQIQNLADATTDQDALNRRTADARYTQPSDVTLQSGYNNSTNPVQIITSLAKGAFIVKAGNANNNLTIFDLQNNTSTSTMSVTGNGLLTVTNIEATNVEATTYSTPSNAGDIVHKTSGALPSIGIFSTGEGGLINSSNKGNIQIGDNVMSNNTTGGTNVVIGNNITPIATGGNSSTMIGEQILQLLPVMGVNTMIGRELGESCTTASNNVVMGYRSLEEAQIIRSSIVLGRQCLSGGSGLCDDTIAIGQNVGIASGSGSYNQCILIGCESLESTSAAMVNVMKLGYGITSTAVDNNTCTIGNTSMNTIQNNGNGVCDLGSTSKQFKDIHLSGNIVIGGTSYKLPNVDGSPGQVLSTNGSGVLSWVNN